MRGYLKLRKRIFEILKEELPNDLYYHGIHHTLNVLKVSHAYIRREQIDSHKAKLLRLGVLLHDIGFADSREDHEKYSSERADKLMTHFGFERIDILIVKDLILATRYPQNPKNQLQRIICDSDLDYLGRDDFYEVGDLLFKELKAQKQVKNKREWNKMQIRFLLEHHYHTDFARKHRQPNKELRIAELKAAI